MTVPDYPMREEALGDPAVGVPAAGAAERAAAPAAAGGMVTIVLNVTGAADTCAALGEIERAMAGESHEIIGVYDESDDRAREGLSAVEAMPNRPATLRLVGRANRAPLAAAAEVAAGDVVVLAGDDAEMDTVRALAQALRAGGWAIAIAPEPRARGSLAAWDLLLAVVAGMPAWNPLTGDRAYAAAFLERMQPQSVDALALRAELLVKAQQVGAPVGVAGPRAPLRRVHAPLGDAHRWVREALWAPLGVWALWAIMAAGAFAAVGAWQARWGVGGLANVALPAAAAFAFTLAVRRARGRTRLADAFFPLVLLNPLFVARAVQPFEPRLMAAGLLGLLAGAIIAMKQDKLRRYLAVVALALLLSAVSDAFMLLLPALAAWLVMVGYGLAKGKREDRTRGYIILAAAEVALVTFGLACILIEPTPAPHPRTLFATIVGFAEFPLLVLAIVMLAIGWRPARGAEFTPRREIPAPLPRGRRARPARAPAPPYFAGMLAFLIGMLGMLLNNFQSGTLPPPGADQTVLILCLVYTVAALHGPRKLQWLIPPLLLAAAVAYTARR
jgi:hypothetical protein